MSNSLTPSSSCPVFLLQTEKSSRYGFWTKSTYISQVLQMHETTGGCTLWPIAGWCLTNYRILCYLVFKLCHIVDTCPASALSFPSLWLELQMMDIHRCFEWTNTHDEIVKNSTHLWNQEHCGGVESHCSLQKAASRHPYKRYSYVPIHHDVTAHCKLDV